MKLWKSPALYFGIFLILAMTGALIAPYVVDWDSYRADIEAYGSKLTGRTVKVAGPITARLFPWPKLTIEDVAVGNPQGAAEPNLLAARRMDVRVALAGLFNGQISVESVDIVEPTLSLERLPSGSNSWRIAPAEGLLTGRLLEHVKLDRITLSDGTIHLIDNGHNAEATLDDVSVVLSAPGIAGPWRIRGTAEFKDRPIDVAVNTGAWRAAEPFKFSARVASTDGSGLAYSFDGAHDGKEVKGGLTIEPAASVDGRSDAEGQLRPLVMTAQVSSDFDTIALDKIEIAPREGGDGSNLLTGTARVALGATIELKADLAATRFDFDAVAGAKAKELLRNGGGLAVLDGLLQALPGNVEVDAAFKVTSLVAGGAALEGVVLSFDAGHDAVHIRELSADMPGQARGLFKGVFVTTDAGPQLLGDLAGETSDLREFVKWAWPEATGDIARIWTGSRGRLKLETKVDVAAGHLRFQDAALQIGDDTGTGALSLSFGTRPSIDLALDTAGLDFDALVPNGLVAFAPSGEGWAGLAARLPALARDRDLKFQIQTDALKLNGVAAKDVAIDVAANDTAIDVRAITIGQVGDAKLEVTGLVRPLENGPLGSISGNVTAQDPRGLLQLLGIVPPASGASWVEALGETDLEVNADFHPDQSGPLAALRVSGRSGLLGIEGTLSAALAADDWLKSEVSGSATVTSLSGEGLLKLAGLRPVIARTGDAKLTFTATGSLAHSLLSAVEADMFGARLRYQGKITQGTEGWRTDGRVGIFSDRAQGFLAALGIAANDGVLSAESDVKWWKGTLDLPTIEGVFSGSPFSGMISLENGTKLAGEIATGPVSLVRLVGLAFMPWTGSDADLEGAFASGLPGGLGGELWIKPKVLDILPGLAIAGSQIGISAGSGEMRLAVAGKTDAGEDVQVEIGAKPDGGGRAIDGRMTLPVDLAQALRTKDEQPVATGSMELTARFGASGRSPAAVLAALKGSGSYSLSAASLSRVDAAGFAELLGKAKSAEDVKTALAALITGGGLTLDERSGSITIVDGVASFYPISVTSPTADLVLTPSADIASGSIDLAAKIQLKAADNLPMMQITYVGEPEAVTQIVDSNALESYLGLKVLNDGLTELERLQREQQKLYEEEEKARKEDQARLEVYYAQRRELQMRLRELNGHRINQQIMEERAKKATEQEVKDQRAMNTGEMDLRVRELRVHRRMKLTGDRRQMIPLDQAEAKDRADQPVKPAATQGQASASTPDDALREPAPVPQPKPRVPAKTSSSAADIDPSLPVVLVPPALEEADDTIFSMSPQQKQWLQKRARER